MHRLLEEIHAEGPNGEIPRLAGGCHVDAVFQGPSVGVRARHSNLIKVQLIVAANGKHHEVT